MYTLHSATTENRTCPGCYKSRAKDCFYMSKMSLSEGGCGEQMAMDVVDPLRSSGQQACSPAVCTSVPGLWLSSVLLLWLLRVHKLVVYLDLCLIFLLLRFSLKSRHGNTLPAHNPEVQSFPPILNVHTIRRVIKRSCTTFYCLVSNPWL